MYMYMHKSFKTYISKANNLTLLEMEKINTPYFSHWIVIQLICYRIYTVYLSRKLQSMLLGFTSKTSKEAIDYCSVHVNEHEMGSWIWIKSSSIIIWFIWNFVSAPVYVFKHNYMYIAICDKRVKRCFTGKTFKPPPTCWP